MADNDTSNPVGNPQADDNQPKMDEATVAKLLAAFGYNANITAACAYAGISRQTYYKWVEDDPTLLDKIEEMKNQPYLKAVQLIVKQLDPKTGDPEFALKYMKLRHPEEFRTRQQLADPDDNAINTGHEALKEIAEAIKNANTGRQPNNPSERPAGLGEVTDPSSPAL